MTTVKVEIDLHQRNRRNHNFILYFISTLLRNALDVKNGFGLPAFSMSIKIDFVSNIKDCYFKSFFIRFFCYYFAKLQIMAYLK